MCSGGQLGGREWAELTKGFKKKSQKSNKT